MKRHFVDHCVKIRIDRLIDKRSGNLEIPSYFALLDNRGLAKPREEK